MRRLEVRLTLRPDDERLVGTLAELGGRVFFEYDPGFLAGGLDLSPFKLPFLPGLFEHRDRQFGPLPGLFDDSLPDGWGLLLLDRHLRSLGRSLAELGPLDRLAWLGTRGLGALTYHPPSQSPETSWAPLDLQRLGQEAQAVLAGTAREVLPQLLAAGGSPGGARPKVLVGLSHNGDRLISGEALLPEGFEAWLVKFAAREDGPDSGALEQAYALMAAEAGVELPPTRLFETPDGGRHFGVRRFDRGPGGRRYHMHSFGNLLQLDFRVPSADYRDLLKATRLLTRNHGELLAAFRRMVFNVLARNRDDHVKNFAFLLDDQSGQWRLSPAYDLTFSPGPGGEHSLTVAGEGRTPGLPQIQALAKESGLSKTELGQILEAVQAAVANWPAHARTAGLPKTLTRTVGKALGG